MKDIAFEERAREALEALLAEVPIVRSVQIEREAPRPSGCVDIIVHLEASGHPHRLICEVKSSGQPRIVRGAVLQLRHALSTMGGGATALFVAPYLSPDSRALCTEAGVSFIDLEGNARLAFDGVFIDRRAEGKPAARRRDLKSLFKPRSARVLRALLREPARRWRVTELSAAADVSLGHVSNVRTALVDREWGAVARDGLFLSAPRRLLEAWRDAYEAPASERHTLYTVLHGTALDDAVRPALSTDPDRGCSILASFSAAQWLAPYARIGTRHFYADGAGSDRLATAMRATPSSAGGNVTIMVTRDDGVFRDAIEPAPGVVCTSPVQTYLDLSAAGERGREAADHLRGERLAWPT